MIFSDWSRTKQIVSGSILIVVLLVVLLIVLKPSMATKQVRDAPTVTLLLETSDGKEIEVPVKMIARNEVKISNVKSSLLRSEVLYSVTNFAASITFDIGKLGLPMRLFFFDEKGDFITMARVGTDTGVSIDPEVKYQHILIIHDDLLETYGISDQKVRRLSRIKVQ